MTQLHDKLIHLNGECGTKRPGLYGPGFTLTFGATKKDAYDAIKDMYKGYISGVEGSQPDIHFAFEDDRRTQNFLRRQVRGILQGQTIVIVGYSFPDYNEKVDTEMLRMMAGSKNVFLQVSNSDTNVVIQRIKRLLKGGDIEITPWQNVEGFYKPLS